MNWWLNKPKLCTFCQFNPFFASTTERGISTKCDRGIRKSPFYLFCMQYDKKKQHQMTSCPKKKNNQKKNPQSLQSHCPFSRKCFLSLLLWKKTKKLKICYQCLQDTYRVLQLIHTKRIWVLLLAVIALESIEISIQSLPKVLLW